MLNSIKVAKLREKMKALDLDGFLVTSKENRQYLTGFTGTFGWVLVTHRDVYLMTDFRYVATITFLKIKTLRFNFFLSMTTNVHSCLTI